MAGGTRRSLFRAEPLPTRRHPGLRRRKDAAAGWGHVHGFVAGLPTGDERDGSARSRLAAIVTAVPPTVMTPAGIAVLYQDLVLSRRYAWKRQDFDRSRAQNGFNAMVLGLVGWFLGAAGGRALALALDQVRVADAARLPPRHVRVWSDPFFAAARSVLVQASALDYEAAMAAFADIVASEGWRAASVFAFVLADDRPEPHALQALAVLRTAVAAGADPCAEPDLAALIVEVPPLAAASWRGHRRGTLAFEQAQVCPARLAATLSAVAARQGQPASPALSWLLHQCGEDDRTAVAKALLASGEDNAFDPLLPHLHRRWARAALARAEACEPAWIVGRYLVAFMADRGGPVLRARLQASLRRHGIDRVRTWAREFDAPALACLDALTGPGPVGLAPRVSWPAALRDPPWRHPGRRAAVRSVLHVAPLPTPLTFDPAPSGEQGALASRRAGAVVLATMARLPGAIAALEAAFDARYPGRLPALRAPCPTIADGSTAALAWLEARLDQLDTPASDHAVINPYQALLDGLEEQPVELALRLWRRGGPPAARGAWREGPARPMLERFGAQVLPELVGLLAADPAIGLRRFADLGAGEVAPVAAHAFIHVRSAKAASLDWLRRHRSVALMHLLPRAVGPAGRDREEAGVAIRRLHADPDGPLALAEIVSRYAVGIPSITEAVAEVLACDDMLLCPDRPLPLPAWFIPAALSRPALRSGGALDDDAVAAIGEILSFGRPGDLHAGVEMVRQACTPASLGAFVADLLAAWLAAGTPGQHGWALRAVGLLGDDGCIAPLVALVRRCIESRALPQAGMGIEALADIASDAAISQLGALAQRLGSKSMRAKALRHLQALAQARGLTPEELGDRTTSDLGLDARGGLDLDFGPRRFRVVFDAALKPAVQDAIGLSLSDLPRPRRADDAASAAVAIARWRGLKREARAVTGSTILRLDAMLATGRRVSPDLFLTYFVQHPFVQNLSRRLLWGIFDDAAPDSTPRRTFRLGEGCSCIGVDDDRIADLVPGSPGVVGLVHPLQVTPEALAGWRAAFARHGIVQPCSQFDRAVYRLSTAERGRAELVRFQGLAVEAGWLRGMGARGWPFGRPVEDGLMWSIERTVVLRDTAVGIVCLEFAAGIQVGTPGPDEAPRVLDVLRLRVPGKRHGWCPQSFDHLDAVTASEMLRTIDALARHGSHPAFGEATAHPAANPDAGLQ